MSALAPWGSCYLPPSLALFGVTPGRQVQILNLSLGKVTSFWLVFYPPQARYFDWVNMRLLALRRGLGRAEHEPGFVNISLAEPVLLEPVKLLMTVKSCARCSSRPTLGSDNHP